MNPQIGDRVKHERGKYGTVYAIDPGSASTPGDQVIAVKFADGTSVNARASEFELVARKGA